MKQLLARLDNIGFEGSRRAVAALALSFFISLYLLVSMNAPDGWGAAFVALAACYLVAFLAVAAEWFWGRWFASGLGWSGVMVSVAGLIMVGELSPPLIIYGSLHGLVVLALLGKKMVARYDMQEAWRQRYGMDEFGVARLRKTVTRASASLPSLILYALGPKNPEQGLALAAAAIGATVLATIGLRGVIRMRSWGVLGLGAAAVVAGSLSLLGGLPSLYGSAYLSTAFAGIGGAAALPTTLGFAPVLAAALLGVAVLPFVAPAIRFIRRDPR